MRILPFRAHIPNIEGDAAHFTRHIRDNFAEMLAKGVYRALPKAGFLVCQIQTTQRTHTGFIALTDIRDFIDGSIKKHEGILPEKAAHHKNMTIDKNAMVKPVLLAHWKSNRISKLLTEITAEKQADRTFSFIEEEQMHHFWVVDAPEKIATFEALFTNIKYSFIADGHHRAAAMAGLYQETGNSCYQYLLSAYFSTEELKIHAYHRLFKYPNNDTQHFDLLKTMGSLHRMNAPILPQSPRFMAIFYQNQWYKMRWQLPYGASYATDIALLNQFFFPKCPNFDAAKQLQYVEGIHSTEKLIEKANASPNSIIFCLSPITFKALGEVVKAENTFPAKSTWFEPRIKSGLVAYLLDETR
jgi:uncharacterized protein (DUF1015 family)